MLCFKGHHQVRRQLTEWDKMFANLYLTRDLHPECILKKETKQNSYNYTIKGQVTRLKNRDFLNSIYKVQWKDVQNNYPHGKCKSIWLYFL